MPTLDRDNWVVTYEWSEDSGLRLGPCSYKGTQVLYGASVPFVYVKYAFDAFGPFTDVLRTAEGGGGHDHEEHGHDEEPEPAHHAAGGPVDVRDIMMGFDVRVTYDVYGADYQYSHVWRFHDDGQFASTIVIHGPGEEILGQHIYHVPFRFDLDLSGASGDSFQRWVPVGQHGGFWSDVLQEGRQTPSPLLSTPYDWQVIDKATGRRAMIRAGEHDNGEIWALRYSDLENWSSWGGAQASPPGTAGSVPAVYSSGQSVQDTDIVIWYIAHVSSHDLIATCGPWFKLAGF
jgi:hypothetical protein